MRGVQIHVIARPMTGPDGPNVSWLDEILAVVDEYPIDRISTGDGQGNHLECLTALGYMAAKTRRVHVGPLVTQTATRDPGEIAAALASLDAISGGRVFLVLGRGDGIAHHLDRRARTIAETREALTAIRGLLYAGAASFEGRNLSLPWPGGPIRRVPLYLVAEGPKMLAMAAATADGVYLGTGLTVETIAATLAATDDAVSSAGREARPDLWWSARTALAATREEAVHSAAESLSSAGNHALIGDYGAKGVPKDLWPALGEYHERYDYTRKGALDGRATNADLMESLGLTDYFCERFGVVGTPADAVERLKELRRHGVDKVVFTVKSLAELELLGTQVLPHVIDRARASVV